MIPKVSKSRANYKYNILMSFIKKKTEEHLKKNGMSKNNQIGFSEGGRTEFNIFVLQYLVGGAQRIGERLFVLAIDFKMALGLLQYSGSDFLNSS